MSAPRRRSVLAAVGLGGAAAGLGRAAAARDAAPAGSPAAPPAPAGDETVAFHGPHQAGIATPAQAHATFLALDLHPAADRAAVVRLMRVLSDDGARLTAGRPALGDTEPELAPRPSRLTVTFGFGPGLFDRLGLGDRRPAAADPLPAFRTDALQSAWSDGHLFLQVCCDDAVTLAHAVRMLVKDARGTAAVRWVQRGFGPARGSAPAGTTMRNLMGQVDGTVNPVPGTPGFDAAVWSTGPGWFTGGTVLVVRRIRMDLDAWDAFDRAGKELVVGRRLDTGAPLTGTHERDVADLAARDADGFLVIDDAAHVRLAHAQVPAESMLRRGYNYDEGPTAAGTADAGLLFAAYQADARTAFVPVQRRLAATDALNRWITHVGSAVFALPPGAADGEYVGQGLLEG